LGTRHAAALGLSERCDAMCLLVSEETGKISFSLRGDLVGVKDLEELQDGIEIFLTKHLPRASGNIILDFLAENWREKLIAVVVTILLWVFFVGIGGVR
ncbi:MAG: diadenylate cyclase, partial [Elusimicrobiota bacterium]